MYLNRLKLLNLKILCIETPPYIYRENIINFRKHLPNNNNNILLWCNA
nr:MAG TPA: hypothetical protein [Caudoviricetes sp.]